MPPNNLANAVELATRPLGEGPPLLLLHGLLGFGRNLQAIAKELTDRYTCHLVDMRNHGQSPWSEIMTYDAMAQDLLALMDNSGWASAAVLGHSMGGKAAMALALQAPERVERLVVADIAPVAYEHDFLDYIEAMLAIDLEPTTKRSDVDAALKTAIPEAGIRGFLMQNLVSADNGQRWRINLEVLRGEMASITGFPEDLKNARYEGPTLFLRGDRSNYVRDEYFETIRAMFPNAQIETIKQAGHWLHAEQPAAFAAKVRDFLTD